MVWATTFIFGSLRCRLAAVIEKNIRVIQPTTSYINKIIDLQKRSTLWPELEHPPPYPMHTPRPHHYSPYIWYSLSLPSGICFAVFHTKIAVPNLVFRLCKFQFLVPSLTQPERTLVYRYQTTINNKARLIGTFLGVNWTIACSSGTAYNDIDRRWFSMILCPDILVSHARWPQQDRTMM